jgi:hypothetical protein
MTQPFYVTSEERSAFAKLPEHLVSAWQGRLVDERLDAYESAEELADRMRSPHIAEVPGMAALIAKAKAESDAGRNPLDSLKLKDLPKAALPHVLYALGATGLTVMIGTSLLEGDKLDSSAMEGISALTRVRHSILSQNAAA